MAFVAKALGPDADPEGEIVGFQLGMSFGTISFLFWQHAAARPAPAAAESKIDPRDFAWQRGALGVAAATAVCYMAAWVPAFLELLATDQSDREWFTMMVLLLFVIALPLGGFVGLMFVPAFLLGRRRAWYGRAFYVFWGWVIAITAAFWTTGGQSGGAGAELRTWILTGAFLLGPLVGWAFWAGAYGPLARRVLKKT